MLLPGLGRNDIWNEKKKFILFFYVSWPSMAKNEAKMNFLNFLGMLQLGSGRNSTQNDFLFLFFGLSLPDLAKSEAKIIFIKIFPLFRLVSARFD